MNSIRLLISVLLCCLTFSAYSQQRQIKGILKTNTGKPVAYATVTVKSQNQSILTFKASDVEGNFSLLLPDTVKITELFIEVNYLGYKKSVTPIAQGKVSYEILMEEQVIDLSEIEIKSRPRIRSSGDTLSYDVGSFAKGEDRTIGDVIKRMPGMEVNESGQIKYNGKDISNLYVDGDDLLDDRYGVGTKTIPNGMVQDVEVMQNHQPNKVLKGKALSEDVALNLKIKDTARLKLAGQIKVGAGLPGQYDEEINSILFNKKYKMLNVLKGNNTGTDLAPELTAFNQPGMRSNLGNSRPSPLLSTGTVGVPELPTNRYYFNNSGSLNANNLFNIWNGWQLKTNASLLVDKNKMDYLSVNETYIGQDTINYTEQQSIEKSPFIADLSVRLEANKDKYYFNNSLKLGYNKQVGRGALLNNNLNMGQYFKSQVADFSNRLQYIPAIGKNNVISLNWYLNYFNNPQTLNINPGINADVFNGGLAYKGINQYVETPTWFSNASIGVRFSKGLIKQNYQFAVQNEWQELNSELRFNQIDGQKTPYIGNPDNHVEWTRHQTYLNSNYELKKGKWETILSLPLSLQYIAYRDSAFGLSEKKNRFLFNPSFRTKYYIQAEDYLSANYAYTNQTGNINGIYHGTILTNYRSLEANNAILQEQHAHNFGMNYNFQRTISMLYINAGISYTKATSNTIASREITNNISSTVLLPYTNDVSAFSASAGFSKYVFALGATTGVKASWGTTRFNQFLNETLLPYKNISFTIQPSVEARLWDQISLKYEGSGSWITSNPLNSTSEGNQYSQRIRQSDQTFSLGYSPVKNTFLRFSGRHQYTSQQQTEDIRYFFADANIRHRIQKWRIDIELDITNLANIKAYDTYSLSANQFGYNHYNLRGMMAVLKFLFNL